MTANINMTIKQHDTFPVRYNVNIFNLLFNLYVTKCSCIIYVYAILLNKLSMYLYISRMMVHSFTTTNCFSQNLSATIIPSCSNIISDDNQNFFDNDVIIGWP